VHRSQDSQVISCQENWILPTKLCSHFVSTVPAWRLHGTTVTVHKVHARPLLLIGRCTLTDSWTLNEFYKYVSSIHYSRNFSTTIHCPLPLSSAFCLQFAQESGASSLHIHELLSSAFTLPSACSYISVDHHLVHHLCGTHHLSISSYLLSSAYIQISFAIFRFLIARYRDHTWAFSVVDRARVVACSCVSQAIC